MIKSMTGYGRECVTINFSDIIVEIKSVNNRYYDFSARLPKAYGYLEDKLKTLLQNSISRGKVEVSVSIYKNACSDEQIEINMPVAKGYIDALKRANTELNLTDDITISQLVKFPDIFSIKKTEDDEDKIWKEVESVAVSALESFMKMREAEGQKIKEDLQIKLGTIENLVIRVETRSPSVTEEYKEKLFTKLKELLSDNSIDEQRILLEAAIFSEKTAVDEETVRLHSHISQFRTFLQTSEPVGRRLDFLVQEMNREVNTIGSKSQDLEITKLVVDLKSEIEKIREQIQNIE